MPEQRDRVVRQQQMSEVGKRRAEDDLDADFPGEIEHFQQSFDMMGISNTPGGVARAAGIVLQEALEKFPGEIVFIAGPGSIPLEFFLSHRQRDRNGAARKAAW